jgi:hypothetical protein
MFAAQHAKPGLGPAERRSSTRTTDVVRVLWSPRQVFLAVEDVPRYGWALVILLTCVALIGYAQVETGLVDRAVAARVQAQIQAMDLAQKDVIERSVLREQIESIHQAGEFERVIRRIGALIAMPAQLLIGALIVSALLYGVVALTGRKPEWHTLFTVTVFSSSVIVLGLLVRLGMVLHFESLEVDTSLMPLVTVIADSTSGNPQALAALGGLLSAIDPFVLWFWWLIVVGCRATSQLAGWRAWLTCGGFWMFGAVIKVILFVASAGAATMGGGGL